ncbi:MAG: T9SS type A sorting domain-containing protein [Bacteroidales bacterium]|nr:T9SS type A sorting domain-containing protein [Bacteroidales bacterium]
MPYRPGHSFRKSSSSSARIYEIGLEPVIHDPGSGASDHARFWQEGYGAIMLIESYWGGDFNPFYHSVKDRISEFNLPYFFRLARLALGSIATLAYDNPLTHLDGGHASDEHGITVTNYPNPFAAETRIIYHLPAESSVEISLFNPAGTMIYRMTEPMQPRGWNGFRLDATNLGGGVYFLKVSTPHSECIRKILRQ